MNKTRKPTATACAALVLALVSATGCNAANDKQSSKTGESSPTGSEKKSFKVLTVGNSFSDDTMEYVYKIAESAGKNDIVLGNLYIGGCSLATHALNAKNDNATYEYRFNDSDVWKTENDYKLRHALEDEDWDFVSLQQASGSSGVESTYNEDLDFLISYVKEHAPNAKIVWNMTWAYAQSSTHAEFNNYDNDQMKMYESIVGAVKNKILTNSEFVKIAPCGTAIQNARTSFIGDNLTRDGYHLTMNVGRYIAGLTFVETLTGVPATEISFKPDGVTNVVREVAVTAAHNAALKPFEITSLSENE